MKDQIEINNATAFPIKVSACRSKMSKRLYVHIGEWHDTYDTVDADNYMKYGGFYVKGSPSSYFYGPLAY